MLIGTRKGVPRPRQVNWKIMQWLKPGDEKPLAFATGDLASENGSKHRGLLDGGIGAPIKNVAGRGGKEAATA